MKNIKIDGLVYNIPESWEDVSIELFQDYTRHHIAYLTNEVEDESYEIMNKLRIISAITRIPIEKLELLDINNVKLIYESISFINSEPKKNLPVKITIDGHNLYLMDLKNIKFKEVVNIELYTSDTNPILVLDKIIGILYTSDNEEINQLSFEDKCKKIREQVTISGIYNLPSFFLNVCQILGYHLSIYSTLKNLKKEKRWMKWMMTKMKYHYRNIITHWRSIYLVKKYSILTKFSN